MIILIPPPAHFSKQICFQPDRPARAVPALVRGGRGWFSPPRSRHLLPSPPRSAPLLPSSLYPHLPSLKKHASARARTSSSISLLRSLVNACANDGCGRCSELPRATHGPTRCPSLKRMALSTTRPASSCAASSSLSLGYDEGVPRTGCGQTPSFREERLKFGVQLCVRYPSSLTIPFCFADGLTSATGDPTGERRGPARQLRGGVFAARERYQGAARQGTARGTEAHLWDGCKWKQITLAKDILAMLCISERFQNIKLKSY